MADLSPQSMRIAASQHGLLTLAQLTECGVSRHTVRRLERSGLLVADHKSVRRLLSAPRTLEQRCAALSLAHPAAFVTGPTAGTLIRLRKMPRHSPITMSSRHPLHVEHLGVRFRRSTKVDARDRHRRSDGISIATPARLAFDLAAWLNDRDHRSIVDQLIHEHGVTTMELAATGQRLCHPGRRGSRRFIESISTVTNTPTESDAELTLATALLERNVPIETNVQWLHFPNGRRARLDLAVPAIRWGIEVDVHPSHLGIIGSSSDKQRDRQSRQLGWVIDRVTALDMIDLDATADELATLYRLRCQEVAA